MTKLLERVFSQAQHLSESQQDALAAEWLAKGLRTKDIASRDEKTVTTKAMGAAILEELKVLA